MIVSVGGTTKQQDGGQGMKRFMAAAVAFLSLAAFVTPAMAVSNSGVTTSWILEPLRMRHQVANSSATVDSSFFSEGATTYKADTTAPFSVEWPVPDAKIGVAAVDTAASYFLLITAANTSSITASSDTIYLQQQVSYDGANWINVTPTRDRFVATTAQPTNMPDVAEILLEKGSSEQYVHQAVFGIGTTGTILTPAEGSTTAPTAGQVGSYPWHRYCMYGDYSGRFKCEILHRKPN